MPSAVQRTAEVLLLQQLRPSPEHVADRPVVPFEQRHDVGRREPLRGRDLDRVIEVEPEPKAERF
ncbi:MAG: hypothetical protein K8U03_09190 [Planctomycetia bacterium]|nr:hypothetical protein [Planctomycetia bacterium]